MVNFLTRMFVGDNSGALIVQCIKVLGGSFRKSGKVGDLLVVVIKRILQRKVKYKAKVSKIIKGLIAKALVIRACNIFCRGYGVWLKFNQNAVVLINKKKAPVAKRLHGPMLKEICIVFNFLGTVTRFLV